jgi:hypothetical protein
MPEEGLRQFIAGLGKGSASRIHADVFDEAGVVPIDSRTAGGSQDLQLYDVVQLAHHFGVSVLSALYRLLNLRLLTDKAFEELKRLDQEGRSQELAQIFGLQPLSDVENVAEFYRRYLALAHKLGVSADEIDALVESLGLAREEAAEVLLPDAIQ